jgi:hypothetical protein
MGIVRFALRYPHILRGAGLILFLGITASIKMPTDVFPEIDIPVVKVIWIYTGLSTPEIDRVRHNYGQYSLNACANGITKYQVGIRDPVRSGFTAFRLAADSHLLERKSRLGR